MATFVKNILLILIIPILASIVNSQSFNTRIIQTDYNRTEFQSGDQFNCNVSQLQTEKRRWTKIDIGLDEFETPQGSNQEKEYRYFPTTTLGTPFQGCFSFAVQVAKEAKISLSNSAQLMDPKLEFNIGGWGNTKTGIRQGIGRDLIGIPTPNILSATQFRSFWVKWYNGDIEFGRKGEEQPLLKSYFQTIHPIYFVGVLTTTGDANAKWRFEDPNCPNFENPKQDEGIIAKCWKQKEDDINDDKHHDNTTSLIKYQKDLLNQIKLDHKIFNETNTDSLTKAYLEKLLTELEENFNISKDLHNSLILSKSDLVSEYLKQNIFSKIRIGYFDFYSQLQKSIELIPKKYLEIDTRFGEE